MKASKPFHVQLEEISKINISDIKPTPKDLERADSMDWDGGSFFGNNAPFLKHALTQSKLIKDPIKLVQRAMAVVNRWGDRTYVGLSQGGKKEHPANMWKPFETALSEMGFSWRQIEEVRGYRGPRN